MSNSATPAQQETARQRAITVVRELNDWPLTVEDYLIERLVGRQVRIIASALAAVTQEAARRYDNAECVTCGRDLADDAQEA